MHDRSAFIKLLLLGLVAALLLLLPTLIAEATNDVNSATQSNGTAVDLTATWTEYGNISNFATGLGNSTISISVNTANNYSQARSYLRIKKDGTVLESINLSQSYIPETVTFIVTTAETVGTHYYSWESYCTSGRKCQIYNRTFSVMYLNTGSFGSGSGSGNASYPLNISNATGLSDRLLSGTNTTVNCYANGSCSISSSGVAVTAHDINGTEHTGSLNRSRIVNQVGIDDSQNQTAATLQGNDTTHNAKFDYVNGTFLYNSTYNGNFPNTSLSNYLLTATYGTNFPNSTSVTANNTANTANTTANNAVPTALYSGNFPNATVAANLVNWNATNNTAVRGAISNGSSTNLTYSSSTGIFDLLFPGGCNDGISSKLITDGKNLSCASDQNSGTTTGGGINVSGEPVITNNASLVAGTNITLVQSGNNITISSTGGTGGTTDNASVNPYSMNATNLTSGTVPSARYGTSIYTANISDYSAGSITNITVNPYSMNGSNISSGAIPSGRYGTGIYTQNISNYPTDFPNVTVAGNLANWNATNFTDLNTKVNKTDLNATVQINITQVNSLRAEQDAQNDTHTNLANYLNNTFPGSSFITTLGTIATGVWQGTKIAGAYLVDADRWNGTLTSHNTSISGLQSNDTYFNSSTFPNSTNFRNNSLQVSIDGKLTNVSAGTNITITWSGCPSACVATIASTGSSQTVYFETNTTGANGVTKNWTTANSILLNSSEVWLNGLYQVWNQTYTEGTQSINFTNAPANGAVIQFKYVVGS